MKFVINPDPTPVVKLKIPKKPGPQKSLQEVAAARSTENLRSRFRGEFTNGWPSDLRIINATP